MRPKYLVNIKKGLLLTMTKPPSSWTLETINQWAYSWLLGDANHTGFRVPKFDPIGHISHTWCRRRREEMHQPFQPIEPFKKGLMFFVNQELDSTLMLNHHLFWIGLMLNQQLMLNILGFNKIHDGDLKTYYNLKTINHVWSFFQRPWIQFNLISSVDILDSGLGTAPNTLTLE